MSVINKMLNDLDQREDNDQAQEEIAFLTPPTKRSKKWMISLVVSIVSGILAVIIGYIYYSQLLGLSDSFDMLKPPSQQASSNQSEENQQATGQSAQNKSEKTVPSQPELIVIAKKTDDGKPAERASTLSVVAVQEKPQAKEGSASSQTEQGEQQVAANSSSSTESEQKQPEVADTEQANHAIITSANKPKPPGAEKADSSKMQISRVKLTPRQRIKKVYGAAKKLSQNGLIKEAIAKYEDALEIKPDHQASRSELAALYYGRSMVAESLTVLRQGLAIDPGNSGWSLLAAKIHYKRTNYSAALGYLQLPVYAMDQVEYVALKATTLQKLKDYPAAATTYRQLTAAFPDNGRWWLGLGTTLEAQKEHVQAVSAYRKSLRLSNISQSSRQFVMSRLQQLEN